MPIILSVKKEDTGEVVHRFIALKRMSALLHNGEKEVLTHPGEDQRVDELARDGVLQEVITEKLVYNQDEDKFCFCDVNKKNPDGMVEIDEAEGYDIGLAGIS